TRVDSVESALAVRLEHLGGAGEPQHLECVDGVVETGIDLLDDRTGVGQHPDRRAYGGVDLGIVAYEAEVRRVRHAEPLDTVVEAVQERTRRRRHGRPVAWV